MDVQPVVPPDGNIVISGTFGPDIAAAPQGAVAQATALPQGEPASPHSSGIAPAIAKLFAEDGATASADLSVSYRVLSNPHEIVTVFTDPVTGKEVTQVPSEALIGLAQFFDQQQGVTFDRNA